MRHKPPEGSTTQRPEKDAPEEAVKGQNPHVPRRRPGDPNAPPLLNNGGNRLQHFAASSSDDAPAFPTSRS
jgi:hypothetical protein